MAFARRCRCKPDRALGSKRLMSYNKRAGWEMYGLILWGAEEDE